MEDRRAAAGRRKGCAAGVLLLKDGGWMDGRAAMRRMDEERDRGRRKITLYFNLTQKLDGRDTSGLSGTSGLKKVKKSEGV